MFSIQPESRPRIPFSPAPIPFEAHDEYKIVVQPLNDTPSRISVSSSLGHQGVKAIEQFYNRGASSISYASPDGILKRKTFYESCIMPGNSNQLSHAVENFDMDDSTIFRFFDDDMPTNRAIEKHVYQEGVSLRHAKLEYTAKRIGEFLLARSAIRIQIAFDS